jgi:preprotein translocase subunit SecG
VKNLFNILTIVSAVIMIITVLLQSRSSGLGASFGGDSHFYGSRRGAEKLIFDVTIVAAVVFALSVVLGILSKT